MPKSNVGNNIREARKAKGLTQKELAKLLKCSHTTISKYEQGEVENMPRPRVKKMAEVLGVSPLLLFGFDGGETIQPAGSELSERKREFIKKVEQMSDEQLDRLEQILALIETTGQ